MWKSLDVCPCRRDYTHVRTYVHNTYLHTYVRAYIHTRAHTYIHTHTHTHIHTLSLFLPFIVIWKFLSHTIKKIKHLIEICYSGSYIILSTTSRVYCKIFCYQAKLKQLKLNTFFSNWFPPSLLLKDEKNYSWNVWSMKGST
jgi:hypothetical protein